MEKLLQDVEQIPPVVVLRPSTLVDVINDNKSWDCHSWKEFYKVINFSLGFDVYFCISLYSQRQGDSLLLFLYSDTSLLSLAVLFSHILPPSNKSQFIFNPLITHSKTRHPNFRHGKMRPLRQNVLFSESFLETFLRNNGRLVAFPRDLCGVLCLILWWPWAWRAQLPLLLLLLSPGRGCAAPCPAQMDTARFQSSVTRDIWKKDQKSGLKFPSRELGLISYFLPSDWAELGLEAVQVIRGAFFSLLVSPRLCVCTDGWAQALQFSS